jgi:hypothetical protein
MPSGVAALLVLFLPALLCSSAQWRKGNIESSEIPCGIASHDAADLTVEQFKAKYDEIQPVLIRNAARDWPAVRLWKDKAFLLDKLKMTRVDVKGPSAHPARNPIRQRKNTIRTTNAPQTDISRSLLPVLSSKSNAEQTANQVTKTLFGAYIKSLKPACILPSSSESHRDVTIEGPDCEVEKSPSYVFTQVFLS